MLENMRGPIPSYMLVNTSQGVSASFTNVTSITVSTRKFISNTCTESTIEMYFAIQMCRLVSQNIMTVVRPFGKIE